MPESSRVVVAIGIAADRTLVIRIATLCAGGGCYVCNIIMPRGGCYAVISFSAA